MRPFIEPLKKENQMITSRRSGICRPTLVKGIKRHEEKGEEGLKELSRRPHTSPNKISEQQEKLLLTYA